MPKESETEVFKIKKEGDSEILVSKRIEVTKPVKQGGKDEKNIPPTN